MDDLRRLAEAAPPPPWHLVKTSPLVNGINNEVGSVVPAVWRATAEYIAACSPDRILALLARLAAAESQREALDEGALTEAITAHFDPATHPKTGYGNPTCAEDIVQRYAALKEQPRGE